MAALQPNGAGGAWAERHDLRIAVCAGVSAGNEWVQRARWRSAEEASSRHVPAFGNFMEAGEWRGRGELILDLGAIIVTLEH